MNYCDSVAMSTLTLPNIARNVLMTLTLPAAGFDGAASRTVLASRPSHRNAHAVDRLDGAEHAAHYMLNPDDFIGLACETLGDFNGDGTDLS